MEPTICDSSAREFRAARGCKSWMERPPPCGIEPPVAVVRSPTLEGRAPAPELQWNARAALARRPLASGRAATAHRPTGRPPSCGVARACAGAPRSASPRARPSLRRLCPPRALGSSLRLAVKAPRSAGCARPCPRSVPRCPPVPSGARWPPLAALRAARLGSLARPPQGGSGSAVPLGRARPPSS